MGCPILTKWRFRSISPGCCGLVKWGDGNPLHPSIVWRVVNRRVPEKLGTESIRKVPQIWKSPIAIAKIENQYQKVV